MRKANRRQFMRDGTATILAASTAPAFINATDKADRKPKIVGSGECQYVVQHDCMQVPDHIKWQDTHGVTIDADGLIYVKHRTKTVEIMDAIVVFDNKGRFVRSFGKEYHGGGHGIDIRKEGSEEYLYLCDNKGYIAKTTLKGETIWKQTAPKLDVYADAAPFINEKPGIWGKGRKFSPTNIAFAPDGGFFVGDGYGSNFIIRYDANANVVGHFGGTGTTLGKFQTPHGLWWDDRPGRSPALVVCDRANARLQYFDLAGNQTAVVKDMLFPADIDTQGDLMLVPDLHARITILGKNNKVVTQLGDDPAWRKEVLANNLALRAQPARWKPGKFVHPHDACFDHDGNIYVAEWVAVGRMNFLKKI